MNPKSKLKFRFVLNTIGSHKPFQVKVAPFRLRYYGYCERKDRSLGKGIMMGKTDGKRRKGASTSEMVG